MNRMKTFAGVMSLSALLAVGAVAPANVQAATEHWNDASAAQERSWTAWKSNWSEYSSNYENVSMTPGKNATELNYAWYSHTEETPKVRLSTSKSMTNPKVFEGTQTNINEKVSGYYSNKVTVTDLKENTRYYYQVFQNGKWQERQTYTTKSFSRYSFLYVGDPQIGACSKQVNEEGVKMDEVTGPNNLAARNDAYNWNEILKDAVADHSNVSFMVSAGDQVNTATFEDEYAGYLGAEALRSLPVATTIGNHDSKSIQYSYHYNNPNTQEGEAYTAGKTAAGTDYYYTYGQTLFIVLDTNNYNCATHKNVIEKAVKENPDVKWRVVMFHQDIYGSGLDHSDSDGMVLRTQLTPIMDEFDIDVVLQGHDHTYSRTFQLTGDGKTHAAYTNANYKDDKETFLAENHCYNIKSQAVGGTIVNPEGTVYLEANSSTGSKFYELIPTQQDYIAERSQTWTPSYSVIDVTDTTFKVTTYDASTGKVLDGSSSYTIVKKAEEPKKPETSSTENKKPQQTTPKKQTTVKVTAPKKVANVKVVSKKGKTAKVTWKKIKSVSGYQIAYSYKKNFKSGVKKITVKKSSTVAKTIKSLKKGKTVYVKVRAYKTVNGKKVYGAYSTVKKVKVK